MMRNREATRSRILRRSGVLFNTRGYEATSLRDITAGTGFTKGAIYDHFESKQGLEKASLVYLSERMMDTLRTRIKQEKTAVRKLKAIFSFFESYLSDPPVKGGCPLLNAAIEVDDANPSLRATALRILDTLQASVESILAKGIEYGQLRPGIDRGACATVIIASLEGAIMMSRLRGNDHDICRVTRHLEKYLSGLERERRP